MTSNDTSDAAPLIVDLDGTLVATDTLWESVLLGAKNAPISSLRALGALLSGKAAFKSALADSVRPDVKSLPYRPEVLERIESARTSGRAVLLVTAADQRIAEEVAGHLESFDEAIGTREGRNLRAGHKAEMLVERFGEKGFDYLGDSSADLEVWPHARQAVVVAPSNSVEKAAREVVPDLEVLAPRKLSKARATLKALRPHQWAKNVLLFLPVILAHEYTQPALMLQVLVAFACFSICASSVYVANDLLDLEQDRQHRSKRRRPFASGALSIPYGIVLSVGALAAGLGTASLCLPSKFALVLLGYVAISTTYSFYLKKKLIVDVVMLASLFTYRVIAGGVAATVELSFWLLAFSMFFFTGLAFAKRYSELVVLVDANKESAPGRGYQVSDMGVISSVGPSSGLLAVLVFALYINSEQVLSTYPQPRFLWLICPVLLYWVTRIWILASRKQLDDDPVVFALRDRVSYVAGAAAIVCVILARFLPA